MTVDSTPGIELPTREGYDRWAASYDADGNPLPALEEPGCTGWSATSAG